MKVYKTKINNKITKEYQTWINIFKRCYNKTYQEKHPSYNNCIVDNEWHNFQNFAKWFEENYIDGYQLDKDILVKGNKIYSPETCCFVPQEINSLFIKRQNKRGEYPIGVSKHRNRFASNILIDKKRKYLGTFNTPQEAFQIYKIVKEKHIKEIADKYKYLISEKVYLAMYNYKVNELD